MNELNFKTQQKTLWQSYGKYFIFLLVALLVVYSGWQINKDREQEKLEAASLQYEKMLTALKDKDYPKVQEYYDLIQEKYRKTAYAPMAGLLQARVDVEQNAMDKAILHLQAAVDAAKNQPGPVQHVTRVRLARLLGEQKKYDEAITLLTSASSIEGYVTLYEETKGDIYLLQNNVDKAREAYTLALQAVPPGISAPALQIKLTDLKNKEE